MSRCHQLTSCVSPERLRDLALELVRYSPTGNSVDVTSLLHRTVAAWACRGMSPVPRAIHHRPLGEHARRPTITLDGHDTIHDPCPVWGAIYGGRRLYMNRHRRHDRATQRAHRTCSSPGNLILATHSLHEAPVGHMEGLKALIARGDVFVDAAIVAECGFDTLPIRGKGQCLFEIEITREGEVLHENVARPRGVSNPLEQAARLAHRMLQRHEELSVHADPLIGPETYFSARSMVATFNRGPTRAFMNGTYRYLPDKDWPDVYREVDAQIAAIDWPADITVTRKLFGNGLGYQVSPEAGIVQALRNAYHTIVGRELPLEGNLSVSTSRHRP